MNAKTAAYTATGTAPQGRAARRNFIESFNNACDYAHVYRDNRDAYTFRATEFAAEGIAKGGFNVYRVTGSSFVAVPVVV